MDNIRELINTDYNKDWKIQYAEMRFLSKLKSEDEFIENVNKANNFKMGNMPKLYKYCYFDKDNYSLNNLYNSQVYLKNPSNFNDPFDSVYSIDLNRNDLLSEVLNHLKKSDYKTYSILKHEIGNNKSEVMDLIEKYFSVSFYKNINCYRDKTWVSCFSEVYNSILMWSHYSDCHKGFCIEYDFSVNTEAGLKYFLSPVFYIDKLCDITKYNSDGRGLEFCTLLKSYEWKYEKEWRIEICNLQNSSDKYYNVPKPTAIYLGACIEEQNEKILKEFAKKNNVDTYRMTLSTEDYKLVKVKLSLEDCN